MTKTTDLTRPTENATSRTRGHKGKGAGTPGQRHIDAVGGDVTAPDTQYIGATVSGEDGEKAIITVTGTGQQVINNSGGDLDYGDVVVRQADGSVTTTTTPRDTRPVGVVQIGGADANPISIVFAGEVGQINTTGTVAEGDYLETSTSAGLAQSSGTSRRVGSFGQALADGPNPPAMLFGATDTNAASALTDILTPDAEITATKDAGNPTFNFNALPENVSKVGSTYYCPYIDAFQDEIMLATASDRDGSWSAGSTIFALTSVAWRPGGTTGIYAPHIVEDGGTYYLFYSICNVTTGANGYIGYATATAITGPYTDHGAAILSPGAGAAWDSLRVGEPAVTVHGGTWYMAYMGETTAAGFGDSEKLGIATASAPSGTWTKAAANPIPWVSEDLMADPELFYYGGYWWTWYTYRIAAGPLQLGLLYSADPTDIASWTRHPSNPIVAVGASGAWDDVWVLRGGLWFEDGEWGGVYTGNATSGTLTDCKGGNFRLTIVGTGTVELRAEDIPIDDAGGYYSGTQVEAALQEIGATLAGLDVGEGGHYEVIVSGTAPPVAVTNEAEDDWIYGFVPD